MQQCGEETESVRWDHIPAISKVKPSSGTHDGRSAENRQMDRGNDWSSKLQMDAMSHWVVLAQDTQVPYFSVMSIHISVYITCTSLQMLTRQSHRTLCAPVQFNTDKLSGGFLLHRNNSSFTNGPCLFGDVSYPCTSTDIYWPSSDNGLCAFTQDGWNDGYGLNY